MILFGIIWTVGLWICKAVEHFTSCLMGHMRRSMEDSGAKSDLMNSGVLTQEIIEENNFSMFPTDHFL